MTALGSRSMLTGAFDGFLFDTADLLALATGDRWELTRDPPVLPADR